MAGLDVGQEGYCLGSTVIGQDRQCDRMVTCKSCIGMILGYAGT